MQRKQQGNNKATTTTQKHDRLVLALWLKPSRWMAAGHRCCCLRHRTGFFCFGLNGHFRSICFYLFYSFLAVGDVYSLIDIEEETQRNQSQVKGNRNPKLNIVFPQKLYLITTFCWCLFELLFCC